MYTVAVVFPVFPRPVVDGVILVSVEGFAPQAPPTGQSHQDTHIRTGYRNPINAVRSDEVVKKNKKKKKKKNKKENKKNNNNNKKKKSPNSHFSFVIFRRLSVILSGQ